MAKPFRRAALVGKYQAQGIRNVLEDIAHFLERSGVEVVLERDTALNTGLTEFAVTDSEFMVLREKFRQWLASKQ